MDKILIEDPENSIIPFVKKHLKILVFYHGSNENYSENIETASSGDRDHMILIS